MSGYSPVGLTRVRDKERVERIYERLEEKGWDCLIGTTPSHVLLSTGYWPITGTAISVFTREGRIELIAPEDEEKFAREGWCDEVHLFPSGSLKDLKPVHDRTKEILRKVLRGLGFTSKTKMGCEQLSGFEPASYVSSYCYRNLQAWLPNFSMAMADGIFADLCARLTVLEIEKVRMAIQAAERSFIKPTIGLRAGMSEREWAAAIRAGLGQIPRNGKNHRADGFVFCMSGQNSNKASAAFQHSTEKEIQRGEPILIHCNSYVDGFWTDITRTYWIGELKPSIQQRYEAVFKARSAALQVIRPGISASEVDRAVRESLGPYSGEFRHPTGHGVGFAAIDHLAQPRIHPHSPDILQPGMIFNVEPGLYFEEGGMRQCEMVLVTENGGELLTSFHSGMDELVFA